MRYLIFVLSLITLTAVSCNQNAVEQPEPLTNVNSPDSTNQSVTTRQEVEFSKLSSIYQFSGEIPKTWMVEYIPAIESINIYDPNKAGNTNLDKSLIFIRYFSASGFLTLNTVDILNRSNETIKGHAAVRYEIRKKAEAANFPQQPNWRNGRHKLIDIRYTQASPSPFYVIAYNPELPPEQFEQFIDSLKFHNDAASLRPPITNAHERITKKPFGIYVSPASSPVSPERFTGFHNAVDYEILAGEENTDVAVTAICGGPLLTKQIVNGYGGVATQFCRINDEPVTVIYGHLALASIPAQPNQYLTPNDLVGHLGAANSVDTDGGRKHLHLGINKGQRSDIRGYVPQTVQLVNWLDISTLLPK